MRKGVTLLIFVLFFIGTHAAWGTETIHHSLNGIAGNIPNNTIPEPEGKIQFLAIMLAGFLGATGIHALYLGHKKYAVMHFVVTLTGVILVTMSMVVPGFNMELLGNLIIFFSLFWGLVDAILIAANAITPADGSPYVDTEEYYSD